MAAIISNKLVINAEVFENSLGNKGQVINGVFKIDVNKFNGSGQVICAPLKKGVSVLNLDLNLNENTPFVLETKNQSAFHFVFCLKGLCSFSLTSLGSHDGLELLQTTVIKDEGQPNTIFIPKNTRTIINIISIDKRLYFDNNLENVTENAELLKLLESIEYYPRGIHLGEHCFKISEHVKSLLNEHDIIPMAELLRLEGLSALILVNHIEQLKRPVTVNNASSLSNTELKKMAILSEIINLNPEMQHTINSLCFQSGLSPAKLQRGFKTIHNKTVSDYIRSIRLKKAEQLLRSTDLNISEVVYSIGFTSRSYFCKIFKEMYDCSPKQYKAKLKPVQFEK